MLYQKPVNFSQLTVMCKKTITIFLNLEIDKIAIDQGYCDRQPADHNSTYQASQCSSG